MKAKFSKKEKDERMRMEIELPFLTSNILEVFVFFLVERLGYFEVL